MRLALAMLTRMPDAGQKSMTQHVLLTMSLLHGITPIALIRVCLIFTAVCMLLLRKLTATLLRKVRRSHLSSVSLFTQWVTALEISRTIISRLWNMMASAAASYGSGVITQLIRALLKMARQCMVMAATLASILTMETSVWMDLYIQTAHRTLVFMNGRMLFALFAQDLLTHTR